MLGISEYGMTTGSQGLPIYVDRKQTKDIDQLKQLLCCDFVCKCQDLSSCHGSVGLKDQQADTRVI